MRTLMLVLLLGCGTSPDAPADSGTATGLDCSHDATDASPLDLEGRADCGAQAYEENCTTCHGADGEGTETGPNLGEHVPYHTDVQVLLVLSTGPGEMPPAELSSQELADVLTHLRAWYPFDESATHP